ncbi:MAG: type II toxin-antitoxin system VapC family toxin [Defluviitaleaceae bacterium]|nr:type II toxin-antitoxin system VapC family toxin [Defluviitaleaceae bacterium]
MNILLDTHAIWWFLNGNEKLPKTAKEAIVNMDNTIFISMATIWEVAIKMSIGKLEFDGGIDGFIKAIVDNDFMLLEIDVEHIKATVDLPLIHRDPFDRMIIAQAMVEDVPVMTTDENVLKYDITVIW